MVLGVGLGWVPFTGGWSEFSQFKLSRTFFPDMYPTNLSFPDSPLSNKIPFFCRRLQLWTAGEGYEGWSLANRWSSIQEFFSGQKCKKNIFSDLQNGRHGLVGKGCRLLVGRGLGGVAGTFCTFSFSENRQHVFEQVDFRSSQKAFIFSSPFISFIVQSWQGGLLWRLAWYLRFLLPNYYGEHTHGDQN